ncbi:MAG TPA: superoxide dismutase family protein, partial [Nannocystaceae bacterium]|nr:superoxide dismutase family protein [Nannocystaceae bacterium]
SSTLEPKSGSNASGTVLFTDNGDGTVDLVVELDGIAPAPATHALHIHEFPDCSAEDGTSTGNHWNPAGTMLGELGTVEIAEDGTGTFMKTDMWSIGTGGDNDVVGHSIIIHEAPDGGTRIACGVIAQD